MLVPLGEPGGEPRVVAAPDGRRFAAFPVDGGFRVTDAACPHNRGPLDQGWLRAGSVLVCPWHWYRFDLDTGACGTTDRYRVGVYPAAVHDGAWFADVGEPPAAPSWAERLRAHARGQD